MYLFILGGNRQNHDFDEKPIAIAKSPLWLRTDNPALYESLDPPRFHCVLKRNADDVH